MAVYTRFVIFALIVLVMSSMASPAYASTSSPKTCFYVTPHWHGFKGTASRETSPDSVMKKVQSFEKAGWEKIVVTESTSCSSSSSSSSSHHH